MRRTATAVILLVVLAGACEPSPEGSEGTRSPAGKNADARHVVVDTDLAFDDIMALLYLLQRDDVVIDAVTIAGTGEAHCDPGVGNATRLLALGGETDTPVACGRETPLQGTNAFPEEWRTAVDDLSMLDLPEVGRGADPRGAARLLLDTLDGDATLITLGPLTNVAQALRADPGFASRVPEFVAMAGAIDAGGNTPSGVAEYNVWVDPLAAKEVIESMDVTLVPLDATDDVPFTPFFAETLAAHLTNPEAEAVDAIIAANQEIFLQGGYSFLGHARHGAGVPARARDLEPDTGPRHRVTRRGRGVDRPLGRGCARAVRHGRLRPARVRARISFGADGRDDHGGPTRSDRDDLVRREALRDPASAALGRRAGRRVRRRARGHHGGRDPAPAERGVHV